MQGSTLVMLMFVLVGAGCAVAHLRFRHARAYLLYTGMMFVMLAITIKTPGGWRWIPACCALALALLAMVEGIRESRARLERFRREQQEREAAFGEYMEALAQNTATREVAAHDE